MATNNETNNSNPKYKNENWLQQQYVKQGRSFQDIAKGCGCSKSTVGYWMNKYNIPARSKNSHTPDYPRLKDPQWLREQYIEREKTMYEIADECGCYASLVGDWLKNHGIDTRPPGNTPTHDERLKDPQWLREQYIEREKTMYEIADECGCSHTTVSDWFGKHGIETKELVGENHWNWKGGASLYGPGWDEQKRRAVRSRDGHTCQDPHCSTTQEQHLNEHSEKLHVHHLRKARDVDDPEERNAKENLITLCRDCHRRWERIADAGIVPQVEHGDA